MRMVASWHANAREARVTLRREVRGRVEERTLGPLDVLTLNEAAAILRRPVTEIRRDIRGGFLRAARRKGRVVVTVAACRQFLDEEREDGAATLRVADRIRGGDAKLIPYEEIKKRFGWR
jgi:hypothetical protein